MENFNTITIHNTDYVLVSIFIDKIMEIKDTEYGSLITIVIDGQKHEVKCRENRSGVLEHVKAVSTK